MNPISPEAAARRFKLRVAAKLMMYFAFAVIAYLFFTGTQSGNIREQSLPTMKINISDMAAGDSQVIVWEGRPVIIYRRSDKDIVVLRTPDPRLLDPESEKSQQPPFATNVFRAASPEWFVAIAVDTGSGCTVKFLPASKEKFQRKPWSGGFVESCKQARYDTAGRVFTAQYASFNLIVPQYGVSEGFLFLGRE